MYFYQRLCPFCIAANKYLSELIAENPAYGKLEIERIDENKESARADRYDYWYVPTFYVDGKKLHEGVLTKEKLKSVLDAAMED
jgi:predicted DsbA family dithiol-disulfide isomerase